MAKLAIAITALFALFALTGQAAQPVLQSYRLEAPSEAELSSVSRFFDIEHKIGPNSFELAVPEQQAGLLLSLAPHAKLVDADISASIFSTLERYESSRFRGESRYHSFDEIQAWMKNLQNSYADIAKVVQYGTSRGGRPLSALRISAHPEDTPGVPIAMITAATHGDELITSEVLMSLVEKLVEGNGSIDRMSRIVQSKVIYFIPVVNADGFVARNRYDGNADPNRSYPWPDRPSASPTPSIKALISFFESKKIAASIDFHAYGELTMFPWGYTRTHLPSGPHEHLDQLTKSMSEQNRYTSGPIAETIYVAQGSSCDYYYWKQGTLGVAVEIGRSKVPNPSNFPALFASQEESTWRLLEAL